MVQPVESATRSVVLPEGPASVPSGLRPKRTCDPSARVTITVLPTVSWTSRMSQRVDQPTPKALVRRGSKELYVRVTESSGPTVGIAASVAAVT